MWQHSQHGDNKQEVIQGLDMKWEEPHEKSELEVSV